VTPEQASKNQSAEKAQAVGNNVKQAVSQQQPVVTPKTLPSQANGNGYGLSDAKKSEKTENVPGQEKSSTVQASERELDKNTSTTPDAAELSEADMVKDKIESTGLRNPSKLEGQGPDVAIPSKVEHVVPLVPKLPQKGGIPAGKEETPTIDQVINPTPRSNGSGGQSNDRVSQGFQTISNLDKWFEWNKFYDMKLIQFYHSHNAIKNHQWVNAPPSPPPQAAPFLKTVTRS
jgi:hypothetical protein